MRRVRLTSLTEKNRQFRQATPFPEEAKEFRFADEMDTIVEMQAIDTVAPLLNSFAMSASGRVREAMMPAASPEPEAPEQGGEASLARNLILKSGIYAFASAASPLVSLLLAPFLTRNLSHNDFGAFAVLSTALTLLAGITQLGLGSAFFRSYNYDYESRSDRLDVLSTMVIILSLVAIPMAIAVIIGAPWLAALLLNKSSLRDAVGLVGVIALLQNLTIPGLAWLRAESRAVLYTTLSIANLLVSVAVTIVLVGFAHMGLVGSLIGTGSGFAVIVICTLPIILWRAGIRLRLDIAQGLLSFGLPNVSTLVAVWVLQLSDRLLLSRLGSLEQAANYSIAYSLGGALGVVVLAPFTLAWPSVMFSIAKKEGASRTFSVIFRWYSIILLFTAFGLSLASTVALDIFFPPSYHSSAPIIPIIAVSIVFYGTYSLFTTGVSIQRKTWFAVIFTSISALFNVGLNLFLIPLYGSMGAAISTFLAYALLALLAYIVNQRIYPIPFELGRFFVALGIGAVLYIEASHLAQARETYIAWSIYLGALVLYAGCLVFLGRLPAQGQGLNRKNA